MRKWEILSKIIDKETSNFVRSTGSKYNLRYNSYWWEDEEIDIDDYLQDCYYNSTEYIWYCEWLEDINRIRDNKISEILGERKVPTFEDVFPQNLKIS